MARKPRRAPASSVPPPPDPNRPDRLWEAPVPKDWSAPSGCHFVAAGRDEHSRGWYVTWGDGCDPNTRARVDETGLFAIGPCPPSWKERYPEWRCRAFPLDDKPRHIAAWLGWAEAVTQSDADHLGRDDPEYGWGRVVKAARRFGDIHQIPGCRAIGAPIPITRSEADAEVHGLAEGFRAASRKAKDVPTPVGAGQGEAESPTPAAALNEAKPPANGPFTGLADVLGKLRLAGNERDIVQTLCERSGRVPLCDLATLCEWSTPFDGTWNAARMRLNKKLKKHGWRLFTHNREAVAEALKSSARN